MNILRRIIATLILSAVTLGALRAQTDGPQYGIVTLSVGNLREKPDYEQELGTQALMGTVVEITGQDRYWLQVHTPEPYMAWINEMGVARKTRDEIDSWLRSDRVICTADYTTVFLTPETEGRRVSDLRRGGILEIRTRENGRPLRKRGFLAVRLPSGQEGWVPANDVEDFHKWADTRQLTADNLIREAFRYEGMPYLWGGTAVGGLDCSGLVRMAFFMNGLLLPRNGSQQLKCGIPVDVSHVLEGDFSTLEKGDLLFFGNRETGRTSHVGIYIGDGRMIHASQLVRVNSLDARQPDYYENAWRLLYARRIVGHENDAPGPVRIQDSPFYFAISSN